MESEPPFYKGHFGSYTHYGNNNNKKVLLYKNNFQVKKFKAVA